MNEKVLNALSEQINFEFESAYLYLNLAIAMEEKGFNGYAHWLREQWHEEIEHAERMISYAHRRDVKPELDTIKVTPVESTVLLDVAKTVLEHEKLVTSKICDLRKLAIDEGDQATEVFLQWFISEQVEEEENATDVVSMFEAAGDDKAMQFTVDGILGKRQ